MPLRLFALLALLCCCASPRLCAHGAWESGLTLSIDAEGLLVCASLSLPSAASLLPADAAPLDAAGFARHRHALLAAASRVCVLLDADGAPIPPERVFVSLRDDHEVRFDFVHAASSRPVRLRAPFLSALPRDAVCVFSDLRKTPPARALLAPASVERRLVAP